MNKRLNTPYLFSIFAILSCMVIILSLPLKGFGLSSEAPISNSTSNDSAIMTNKGIELNKIGNYNESIVYFDKALAIDPRMFLR